MARQVPDRSGNPPSSAEEEIRRIFETSGGTYGSPRVFVELVRAEWRVSVNTVAQVMAELGLVARVVRRRRGLTRPGKRAAAPDRVRRDFTAPAPDLVWAGDMTEIATDEGRLYLATVIDLYSRRLLGYAIGAHHDADLVVAALRVGSCFDNAVSEAFNSVLRVEYVHRHHFSTRAEARIQIASWIVGFYNSRRLHSMCGFKSPIDYEHEYLANPTMGLAA
ncbi:IS3 family transposase [Streptomyces sp. XD-27]|uniref:IS3 family transposase n=1 Tax=Streptomyces sp. XD-27 TaxID=3062779 RepID=UPI0026F4328E|nr:IS3 family transposase [Streptomyces sp. XD-27]WKX68590.1 IS3 family transposase [Streptomyces sp. XD-27]